MTLLKFKTNSSSSDFKTIIENKLKIFLDEIPSDLLIYLAKRISIHDISQKKGVIHQDIFILFSRHFKGIEDNKKKIFVYQSNQNLVIDIKNNNGVSQEKLQLPIISIMGAQKLIA